MCALQASGKIYNSETLYKGYADHNEKSIVKHYRQRLRPFHRELVRWRKEE